MWIIKTQAMTQDGELEDREYMQEADLNDVVNLILREEGRVAYSKIEIINYDK